MTAAERRHLSRGAALGCALCRRLGYVGTPAQVLHLRAGQGAGQRAPHWLAIPLCETHHLGKQGIHGDRSAFRNARCDELDLLADTLALLMGER